MVIGWVIVIGVFATLAVFGKCAELYSHSRRTDSDSTKILLY